MQKAKVTSLRNYAGFLYINEGITEISELSRITGINENTLRGWCGKDKWRLRYEKNISSLDATLNDSTAILRKLIRLLKIESDSDIPKREHFAWLLEQTRKAVWVNESLLKQAPHRSARNAKEALEIVKAKLQGSNHSKDDIDRLMQIITEQQISVIDDYTNKLESLTG